VDAKGLRGAGVDRILVTGVAGFIGSSLADRLLELGYGVLGVDAFTEYYDRGLKLRNLEWAFEQAGFRLVEDDLLRTDLAGLVREADAVVHLAAEPGVRASWGENFSRYLRRNVDATQRLLETLSEAGPRPFVFASSSSVYGSVEGAVDEDAPRRPASPYGLSKLAAEELIGLYRRQRGVGATLLRYFTVYGPRQRPEMALTRFIRAAAEGRPIEVYGDGEQTREMTYVADVVEATVAALGAAPDGVFNVGGGRRATVNELVEIVGRKLGADVRVEYGPAAAGDVRSTWADVTRAQEAFGFRPRVGLEEGIEAQVSWVLDRMRVA
jgi:UDP-glucuronate 4-epimerase